jgi:divalent metal cation (Fe/Co/Zn/Cd) transporter
MDVGGVVAGLLIVAMTGWLWIDPLVAIAVGLHIIAEGYRLVRASVDGMMDGALVEDRLANIKSTLDSFAGRDVAYKNLKTRRAGTVSFIQVDILVPRQWTVGQDTISWTRSNPAGFSCAGCKYRDAPRARIRRRRAGRRHAEMPL